MEVSEETEALREAIPSRGRRGASQARPASQGFAGFLRILDRVMSGVTTAFEEAAGLKSQSPPHKKGTRWLLVFDSVNNFNEATLLVNASALGCLASEGQSKALCIHIFYIVLGCRRPDRVDLHSSCCSVRSISLS